MRVPVLTLTWLLQVTANGRASHGLRRRQASAVVGIVADFACQLPNAVLLASVKTIPSYSP